MEAKKRNILDDQRELVDTLNAKKMVLFQDVEKWKKEDQMWRQGQEALKRKRIQDALREGNYEASAFVREFVQSEGLPLTNDDVVEGALRQSLMDIDIRRSTIVSEWYTRMKTHNDELSHLKREIDESKKLLDERTNAYKTIEGGLKAIGVKSEKLEDLHKQMMELKVIVDECKRTKHDCDEVYQEAVKSYKAWEEQMNNLIFSFEENIKVMRGKESVFKRAVLTVVGITYGALVGAEIGTGVVPVIGTLVGAFLGGAIGFGVGALADKGSLARRKERLIRQYTETLRAGKGEHARLKDLIT